MRRSSGTVSLIAQLAAGDARERHEAADLDVVGRDLVLAAVQALGAVDGQQVRADPLDVGAHLHEHAREILDVRLAGGVADHGRARRQRGRHQRVLGGHHRGLVHEHVGRAQPARRGQHDVAVAVDVGAHRAEGVEVRIQAAATDHVAAGRRHHRAAEAREQRAGEQERRADQLGQLGVDLDLVDRRRRTARPRWARATARATPIASRISSIASTSRMRGTLRDDHLLVGEHAAARIGSAPFLLPAGTIVPDSGAPPSMTNFSMGWMRPRRPTTGRLIRRLASVTAILQPRVRAARKTLPRSVTRLTQAPSAAEPRVDCNSRCRRPLAIRLCRADFGADAATRTRVRVASVRRRTYLRTHVLFSPTTPALGAARARRAAPGPLVPAARGRLRRRLGGRPGRARPAPAPPQRGAAQRSRPHERIARPGAVGQREQVCVRCPHADTGRATPANAPRLRGSARCASGAGVGNPNDTSRP